MDIKRFIKQKNALLKMNVAFTIFTDENYSFVHDPLNKTSVIAFDDSTETFVCIKRSDDNLKVINVTEYERALFIQLKVSNNDKAVKDFVEKCDTDLISQTQKDELHNLLK